VFLLSLDLILHNYDVKASPSGTLQEQTKLAQ